MVSFHFVTCQVMRKPAFSFREIQARIGCAIAQDDWRFYLSVPLWLKGMRSETLTPFSKYFEPLGLFYVMWQKSYDLI